MWPFPALVDICSRILKHRMRHQRAHDRADDLNADIGKRFVKFDLRRIQNASVTAGLKCAPIRDLASHQNEQDRAGRNGVSQ